MKYIYFSFVEETDTRDAFIACRNTGPFNETFITREILKQPGWEYEISNLPYCFITCDDRIFIGVNPSSEDCLYPEFTMQIIQEHGLDKIDKTVLADACLMNHKVALRLRPFLLVGGK